MLRTYDMGRQILDILARSDVGDLATVLSPPS